MKKIIIGISQALFILTLIFTIPKISDKVHAVESKVWNEVVGALNKETEAYNSYNLFVDEIKNLDKNSLIAEYTSKSISWESSFKEGISVYEKYSSSPDEQLKEVTTKALNASNKSLDAIAQYDNGFLGELTDEEIQSSLTNGDSLISEASKEHIEAVNLYNNYSGVTSQSNLIIFLYGCLVLSIIFTVILWFKSRTSSHYQSDIIKAQIFKNLLGSSIWMLVGIAITTFSLHYVSKKGGTYYIFYWAIIGGAWQMLKGLWIYFTKDRKTLKQLKLKDQSDLLTKIMREK